MSKNRTAWMPFYGRDYLADTMHLSTEQHGAYFLLILAAWKRGGALPDDDAALAQITRLDIRRWRKHRPVLENFFRVEGGQWLHQRVEEERTKAAQISQTRSSAGAEGNRVRWQTHRKPIANATALRSQNDPPTPKSPTDSKKSPTDSHIEPYGSHSFSKRERDPIKVAFDGWNDLAKRVSVLPRATKLTARRRREIGARLHDGGPDGWIEALHAVEASPLCRGDNARGWRADLDFVCQAKSYQRLREGFYGAKPAVSGVPSFARSVPSNDPRDMATLKAIFDAEMEAADVRPES